MWLHNSRVIATFAVVVLHVSSSVVCMSEVGSGYWWVGNFYDSFVRWCVPVFVMISGALLLDPSKNENLTIFYKKRLFRILVPLLFWSIFYLLWATLKGFAKGIPPSSVDLVKDLISGKPYYHMWFLYMIITLYLFTPFFRKITSKSTNREIEILVILSFSIAALNYLCSKLFFYDSALFSNWFLSYIPFYFLGHLIRNDERTISKYILLFVFFLSSFLTAFGCYIVAKNSDSNTGFYFNGYLSVTVIPMSVSIMYLLKMLSKSILGEKIIIPLSSLTLGIYLIHPIIIEVLVHIGLDPLNFNPVMSIPIVAIIVFVCAVILSLIIIKLPYLKRVI